MRTTTILLALTVLGGSAQAAPPPPADAPNMLTHGGVQMTLKVGQTTQADIIEAFGAPNITTIDGEGREVWVYDRQSIEAKAKSSGFSLGAIFGGLGGAVVGGFGTGFQSNKSSASQTNRSMTLVIKFDATKHVADFKSRSSSF